MTFREQTSQSLSYVIDYTVETFQEANRSDTKRIDTSFLFHFRAVFMCQSLLDGNISRGSCASWREELGFSYGFFTNAPFQQDFYAEEAVTVGHPVGKISTKYTHTYS